MRHIFLISLLSVFWGAVAHAQVNCNSQQLGSFGYTNCSNGLSGSSQQIGEFGYSNFNDGTSITQQSIGEIEYYHSNNPAARAADSN